MRNVRLALLCLAAAAAQVSSSSVEVGGQEVKLESKLPEISSTQPPTTTTQKTTTTSKVEAGIENDEHVAKVVAQLLRRMKEEDESIALEEQAVLRNVTPRSDKDMHKVLEKWRSRSKAAAAMNEHPSKRQRKHRMKKNRQLTRQMRANHAAKRHHGGKHQQAPPQPKKQGSNVRMVKSDLLMAAKDNDRLRQKLLGKKDPVYRNI